MNTYSDSYIDAHLELLNEDINKKADITYVDEQNTIQNNVIVLKADTTYVDQQNADQDVFTNRLKNAISLPTNTFYDSGTEIVLQIKNGMQLQVPDYSFIENGVPKIAKSYRNVRFVACDGDEDDLTLVTVEYFLAHKGDLRGANGINGTNGTNGKDAEEEDDGQSFLDWVFDIGNTAANVAEEWQIYTMQGQIASLGGAITALQGEIAAILTHLGLAMANGALENAVNAVDKVNDLVNKAKNLNSQVNKFKDWCKQLTQNQGEASNILHETGGESILPDTLEPFDGVEQGPNPMQSDLDDLMELREGHYQHPDDAGVVHRNALPGRVNVGAEDL
jgi:hypothetical protein